jgi:hypothetical protein
VNSSPTTGGSPGAIGVAGCHNADSRLQDAHLPAGLYAASAPLDRALHRLQKHRTTKPLLKAYTTCLNAAGYPVTSRRQLYWLVHDRFDHAVTEPDAPWSRLRETDGRKQSVSHEQRTAAVDRRCRAPLHAYAMRALRDDVDTITVTYAEELRVVGDQWARIRAQRAGAGLT